VSYIPPYSPSLPDWQRQVALSVNPVLQGYPFPTLDTAPANVDAGYTYFDSVLLKVRTWDGSAWNNHW
jgi:hypothetical protein